MDQTTIDAAQKLNNEGVQLFTEEKYTDAIEKFKQAIAIQTDANDKLALFMTNRANCYLCIDKLEDALADCTRALTIDEQCIGAYLIQGKAYAYRNKLGQALDILRMGLSKDKGNQEFKSQIAMLEGEVKLDSMVPKSDPQRQQMNQYIDWLKNQGVQVSKIRVQMLDVDSKVVVAQQDIQRGEEIVFVPENLILEIENTGDVPANSWLNWNTKVGDNIVKKQQNTFALYYLHERNNKKFKYKKYFDSLGQNHTNHVVLWNQAAIDVMEGSWLQEHIVKMQKEVEDDFNLIQKEIPKDTRGKFSHEEYKYAWVLADKYFHGIKKNEYRTLAMVPFLNFFDYNDDTTCATHYDEERKGLVVTAARKILRGEEVCLPAGSGSNDWLLMKKGTVSELKKPTVVPFTIELNKDDPMYQEKVDIMGGRITSRTFMLSGDLNTQAFVDYIMFMRFYFWAGSQKELQAMRDEEIQRKQTQQIPYNDDNAFLGTVCKPRSTNFELTVWSQIHTRLEEKIALYTCSLNQTVKELAIRGTSGGSKITISQNTAYTYLVLEKTQISDMINLASLMIKLLSKAFPEFIQELESNPVYEKYRGYIETSILGQKTAEHELEQEEAQQKADNKEVVQGVEHASTSSQDPAER